MEAGRFFEWRMGPTNARPRSSTLHHPACARALANGWR